METQDQPCCAPLTTLICLISVGYPSELCVATIFLPILSFITNLKYILFFGVHTYVIWDKIDALNKML